MIYGVELQKEQTCFTFWGDDIKTLFGSEDKKEFKNYLVTITGNDGECREIEVEICDLHIITHDPTYKWLIFHSEKTRETICVKTDNIKSILFKEVTENV